MDEWDSKCGLLAFEAHHFTNCAKALKGFTDLILLLKAKM